MAKSGYTDVQATTQDVLRFRWWLNEQQPELNRSIVGWAMELIARSQGRIQSSSNSKAWSITVDGNSSNGTNSVAIENNQTKTLASGSTIIYHNADGTKTFSYSFSQYFGISWSGNTVGTKSGSGTGVLDPIIIDKPYLTNAPDFTDETTQVTISYNNPFGSDVEKLEACISLTGARDDIPYRDVDPLGTSYTFNLSPEDLDMLRSQITTGDTLGVKFLLRGKINGEFNYSTIDSEMKLINHLPTLLPRIDLDARTLELNGNHNYIVIDGFTNLTYETGAEARKGATIVQQVVTCGYHNSVNGSGTFNKLSMKPIPLKNQLSMTVTDSRGNSTSVDIPLTVVRHNYYDPGDLVHFWPHEAITSSGGIVLPVNLYFADHFVDIYFDGTADGSLGGVKNEYNFQYRYREQDGTDEDFTDWIIISKDDIEVWNDDPGEEYNTIYQITLTDLDYTKSYIVQGRVGDLITASSEYIQECVVSMVPVFDWSKTDFTINVHTYLNKGLSIVPKTEEYMEVEEEPVEFIRADEWEYNGIDIGYGLWDKAYQMREEGEEDPFMLSPYNLNIWGDHVSITSNSGINFDTGFDEESEPCPITINSFIELDYIKDSGQYSMGSNGTWYWYKWNSGKAECYGTRNFGRVNINTAWGSLYESTAYNQSLPAGLFITTPNVQMNVGLCGYGVMLQRGSMPTSQSKDNVGSFFFVRPTAAVTESSYVDFYCVGRWK